jgi:SOS response regulatory protein OraA/RecX
MSEQEAMAELEGIAPQAQMIEQLIMAVIQMIQQGVSEAEVREFLKEQGLDDEDIEDLFMMVMQQIEQAPAEEPIGQELQGMM